jgi:ribosome-associated protein
MSAQKKKPVAKSAAKSRPAAKKAAKPAVRPARRVVVKSTAIKAKTRSATPVARPMVVIPKLPAHLIAAVKALEEKKAAEVRVLELGQISSVADFLVIATGTSEPHLRALRIELERALDDCGVTSRSESQRDSGWTVVDAFDILFHLFRDDVRKSYALESLWKDGLDIPVSAILKA